MGKLRPREVKLLAHVKVVPKVKPLGHPWGWPVFLVLPHYASPRSIGLICHIFLEDFLFKSILNIKICMIYCGE